MRTQIPGKQILDEGVDTPDIKDSAVTDVKLSTTGVISGAFTKVTVNPQGRVTLGTNPTTLAGYGITDAVAFTDPRFNVSFLSIVDETDLRPGARQVIGVSGEISTQDNGPGVGTTFEIGLVDNAVFPGTGALTLTRGTTAQRPAGAAGMLRFNTTTNVLETPIGIAWKSIVLDDDIRLQPNAKIVKVRTDAKPGEYTSIAAACASITTATEENQWLIDVGPGTYVEPEIIVPSYVHISGLTQYSVNVTPDSSTHPIFTLEPASTVSFVTVSGATGANQFAFQLWDTESYGVVLHKVSIFGNTNGFDIQSINADTVVYLEYCDTEQDSGIGLKAVCANPATSAYVNLENFYVYGSDVSGPEAGILANGPTVYINMQSFGMEGIGETGHAFDLQNGARLDAKGGSVFGWETGAHIENIGLPSTVNFLSTAFHGNALWDVLADHPGATGVLSGTATRTKVDTSGSSGFTLNFTDITNNAHVQTGDFYLGANSSVLTNASDLIIETPTMGLLSGGVLTPAGGLNVSFSAGAGYLRKTGVVTRVDWAAGTTTLAPGATMYIYIDQNGAIAQSAGEPDNQTTTLLGRVSAGAASITALGNASTSIKSHGNLLENYLRQAVGSVYVSGSIVTENASTPRAIDVTAGKWFYGTVSVLPSAVVAPVIVDTHRAGGILETTFVAVIPNGTIDNGTNLVSMTTGYYTKHTLYSAGEGIFQVIYLAHGQAEYATLQEAIDAPDPTPRISPDGVPKIAAVIMQQGTNSIVQILDERPMFFRSAASANGASDHGDLTGLGDDDHPQYMLVTGTRSLSGNLNFATNDITNVGLINGIDFLAHGVRHLPNGVDPLTTAAAVSLTPLSTNTAGVNNSFARSDHTHAITGLQPTTTNLTNFLAVVPAGILVSTGATSWAARKIVNSSGSFNITNPDGIAGDINIDFAPVGTPGTYVSITTDQNGSVIAGSTTQAWSTITGTPTTLVGYGITNAQPLDSDLTALANSGGTGFYIRTGDGTSVTRTMVAPAAGLTITNPDGIANAPTFALANDLAAIEALNTNGIPVRTGTDTWAVRTLVQPGAGITITNPAGVAGNITFALTNDLLALENLTTVGIAARTSSAGAWATRTLTSTTLSFTNPAGTAGDIGINLTAAGTAGTYHSVTTDIYGRVTAGTNPITLTGYGITDAVNVSQLGANSGVATLDSTGRLTAAQIPAIAISDTFVVASQSAQVALIAEVGDIAVRTDLNNSFILRNSPASVFSNWQELLTPTSAVTSVNGQTGAVTLNFVTSIATVQPTAGLTITGGPVTSTGTFTFALANDLAALEGLSGTGFPVRTGADTWTQRSISAGSGIEVANGDGVSGAPTISLPTIGTAGTFKSVTTDAFGRVTAGTNPTTLTGFGITDAQPLDSDLTALSNTATTGLYAVTAAGTSTTRTLTAGSTRVAITNGSGVAGNPTVDAVEANFTHNNIGGTLGTTKGGTNLTTIGTANQTLGVNAAATGLEYKTVAAGTGITVTNGAGVITIAATNTTTGTVTSVGATGSTGLTIGGSPITSSGTLSFTLGTELQGLSALSATGIVTRTAAGTYTSRTLTAGAGISIANANGAAEAPTITNTGIISLGAIQPAAGITIISGGTASDPTFSFGLVNDLGALENLVGTGIAVRTGTDTWAQRAITAGAGITVTNGDGVAGNPTIALAGTASSASGLLSAWTLVSGTRYRSDFAHNLATNNIVITLYDTADNSVVTADNVVLTNTNTVRVTVVGNTTTLRIVVVANGLAVNTATQSAGTITTAKDSVNVNATASRLNFTGQSVSVVDSGAGTSTVNIGARFTFFAASLDTPTNADWAISVIAPTATDPTFNSLTIRQFSNTVEQGTGFLLSIPTGSTAATFRFRGRAATAPGSASVAAFRIYARLVPNNATMTVGAAGWAAVREIGEIPIPTNANFQSAAYTISLSTLGLTAGNLYQIELTRRVAGTTGTNLAANFLLAEVTVELS